MTDYETDYEELRPLGEATQIPDQAGSGGSREQVALVGAEVNRLGYPETVSEATDVTCQACGAPILAERTKCLFCLTNHIEVPAGEEDTPDSECSFLHIIHALVESRTYYGAVAKGAAATNLLAKADSDPTVDDCQLIHDLNEEPAMQLKAQWNSLPPRFEMSARGEQLLETARTRTAWEDTAQPCHDGEHAALLYDETERGFRDEDRLATLLEEAEDNVWIVPVIALQRSVDGNRTGSQQRRTPTQNHLSCRECDRETNYRFLDFEEIPDEKWSGQPMWECQVCGTPRYGPQPGEERQSNSVDAVSAPSG